MTDPPQGAGPVHSRETGMSGGAVEETTDVGWNGRKKGMRHGR
jgi:hypothetical protein